MKRHILKMMKRSGSATQPAGKRSRIGLRGLRWALVVVIALAGATSCFRDKGNYDYTELDRVEIDTAGLGLSPEYSLYRYDKLVIEPDVYFNGEKVTENSDAPLSYAWTIYQSGTGGMLYPRDTLGTAIKLDATVPNPAGSWIVMLAVRHTQTDVESYISFNLQVDESISDGWMVLYERDGDTDAGLIVNDVVKSGFIGERVFVDLYSASNQGQRLAGKPRSILHSPAPLLSGEVLIASEGDLAGVDRNTFERTYGFGELFWGEPDVKSPAFLAGNLGRKEVLINNNRVHIANFMSAGTQRTTRFGDAMAGTYGTLAPWMATQFSNSFDAVVYDQTNTRFLAVDANGVEVLPFAPQAESSQFDINNTGMELVATDWGRNNYEHSLMRSGQNYALMISNFMTGVSRQSTNIAQAMYDLSSCPDIAAATTVAAGTQGQVFYYGAADKLYLYRYGNVDPIKMIWQAPAGEEITCIRIQKFYHTQLVMLKLPNPNEVIYIATWNPNTGTGTVHQLRVNPSSGELNDNYEPRSYSGFGRIVDMGWKWPPLA